MADSFIQVPTPAPPISVPISDNSYSFEYTKKVFEQRRKEIESLKQKSIIAEKQKAQKQLEIERIEAKRKSDLSDQFLQLQLIQALKEIEALKQEQYLINQRIMMLMNDDEEFFILLSSMPFIN